MRALFGTLIVITLLWILALLFGQMISPTSDPTEVADAPAEARIGDPRSLVAAQDWATDPRNSGKPAPPPPSIAPSSTVVPESVEVIELEPLPQMTLEVLKAEIAASETLDASKRALLEPRAANGDTAAKLELKKLEIQARYRKETQKLQRILIEQPRMSVALRTNIETQLAELQQHESQELQLLDAPPSPPKITPADRIVAALARAQAKAAEAVPDSFTYDDATLTQLCDRLHLRASELHASIDLLKTRIEGEFQASTLRPSPRPLNLTSADHLSLLQAYQNQLQEVAKLEREEKELQAELGDLYGGATAIAGRESVVVPNGSWLVTIVANVLPDVSDIQRELADHKRKLDDPKRSARLDTARATLNRKRQEKTTFVDSNGRTKSRARYSESQLSSEAENVRRLENEERTLQIKVRQLEQDVARVASEHKITATQPDGKAIIVEAQKLPTSAVHIMEPGKNYRISGRGEFNKVSGRVTAETVVPVVQ